MAPNYYLKPETALSKAKELINVGKKQNALELLYEMMKLKRGRVWHKNLQDLMFLFVDLCVELKKNVHFRKVIYQYKGIVVQECPQSMELVLRHYLTSIKTMTEQAHQKSKDAILDIDDLDALDTPESLLLNAVTTEGAQDRSDRAILGPWLRFLWESYRLVLDLLRTMSKFERFYYEIAQEAYEFCIKYGRKNEFKKLTEALRLHATRNQWQSNQVTPNPELQSLQLQIRMKQLDTAMDLEMYNDAFKAVEDIWHFFSISKKTNKIIIMKEYYQRTSDLFLRSGCHLFHAAALLKLMTLARDFKRNLTKEEMLAHASQVLCAIMAIPLPQERMNLDKLLISGETNASKMKSLSNLLGLSSIPTRQSLIRDFLSTRMMGILPQELIKLFTVFEVEFQPLKMYELAKPAFDFVAENTNLSQYLNNLHEVCISKTVIQVSQVFRSIQFDHLCSLCPTVEPLKFERILVELIHNLELPIRLDHRNAAVHFDVFTDMGISQRKYGPLAGIPGTVQTGYSTDQLTRQLNMFSEVLQTVNKMLPGVADDLKQQSLQTRQKLITDFQRSQKTQRKKLQERRDLIEKSKLQHAQHQKEMTEYEENLEQERRERIRREEELEEQRLQEEARERERRRAEDEAAHLRRKMNRQHINNLMTREAETSGLGGGAISGNIGGVSLISANTTGGVKKGSGVAAGVLGATVSALKNITDEQLDQFNANEVLEKKRQEMMKRNRELKEKAKQRAQNLDYLTRAIRLAELPKLREEALVEAKNRREFIETLQEEREKKNKEEHEHMLQNRDRLKRLEPQVEEVQNELAKMSAKFNEAQMAAWKKRCVVEREKRLEERKQAYEEEKRREEERRQAEIERAREEEAAVTRRQQREAIQAVAHTSEVDDGFVLLNKSLPTQQPSSGGGVYMAPHLRASSNTAAASSDGPNHGFSRGMHKQTTILRRETQPPSDGNTPDSMQRPGLMASREMPPRASEPVNSGTGAWTRRMKSTDTPSTQQDSQSRAGQGGGDSGWRINKKR